MVPKLTPVCLNRRGFHFSMELYLKPIKQHFFDNDIDDIKNDFIYKRAADNAIYTGSDFYDEKVADLGFFELFGDSVSVSEFEGFAS